MKRRGAEGKRGVGWRKQTLAFRFSRAGVFSQIPAAAPRPAPVLDKLVGRPRTSTAQNNAHTGTDTHPPRPKSFHWQALQRGRCCYKKPQTHAHTHTHFPWVSRSRLARSMQTTHTLIAGIGPHSSVLACALGRPTCSGPTKKLLPWSAGLTFSASRMVNRPTPAARQKKKKQPIDTTQKPKPRVRAISARRTGRSRGQEKNDAPRKDRRLPAYTGRRQAEGEARPMSSCVQARPMNALLDG